MTTIFKCSQDNAFYIRHTVLCANKTMSNNRQYTFIQNHSNIDARQGKDK